MATWVANGTPGTTSATLPGGTAVGDYVMVAAYSTSATLPTLPTGWTTCVSRNVSPAIMVSYREYDGVWAMPTFTGAARCVSTTIRPAAGMDCVPGASANQGATSTSITWAALTLQVTNGSSQVLRFANGVRPDVTIPTPAGHTLIDANGNRPGYLTARLNTTTSAPTVSSAVSRSDVWSTAQVEVRDIPPPVEISQDAYRFYALGTEAGSTALGAQNTSVSADITYGDVALQLRARLQSTTITAPGATDDWCLQWEKNASGVWSDVSIDPTIAEYRETNVSGSIATTFQAGTGFGQSFDGTGKPVVEASFWMSRSGVPAGTVTAYIYAHSGTFGTSSVATGSPLATSTPITATAISTTAGWVDFYFDGTFTPVAGTKYVVLWDHNGTFDASNQILSYVDTTTPTHPGNLVTRTFGGGFTATAGSDLIFNVCGPANGAAPYDDPGLTDGEATTNRLTGGTGGFTAGKVSEDGLVDDLGFAANGFTELLFSFRLIKSDLVNADSLRFRIQRNDDIVGMTYSSYPTISIVAPVAAVTQAAFRFFDIAGTEATGTDLAAQNASITGDVTGSDHLSMLRVRMQSTSLFDLPATDDWRLQFQVNSGAFTNVTTTSGAVQAYSNTPNANNNDPTTERLTGGTGTFEVGKVSEQGTANNIGFLGNNFTEFVYTLQLQSSLLAQGDIVRFQVLRNGVTTGVTYTQVPTINVVKSPPTITQAGYQFFDQGAESTSVALAPQNTAIIGNLATGDAIGQLRMLLQSTNAAPVPTTDDWQLLYEHMRGDAALTIGTQVSLAIAYDNLANRDAAVAVNGNGYMAAKLFTGNGQYLRKLGFALTKNASPTGAITAELRTANRLTVLATSTTSVQASTLTANPTYSFIEFDFDPYFLTNGTQYAMVVVAPATGFTTVNNFSIGGDASSPPSPNISSLYNGTWGNFGQEFLTRVYTLDTWANVPTSAVLAYNDPALTDGQATTNRMTGTGTFTPGKVSKTGLVVDLGWTGNNFTEVLYPVQISKPAVANGDTIRFRVLREDVVWSEALSSTYNETNWGGTSASFVDPAVKVGQSFLGDGKYLTKAGFYARRLTTATGNIVMELYAHDAGTFGTDGKPTGTPLATSAVLDLSTVSTTMGWVELAFASPVLLTNGTPYFISVFHYGGAGSLGVGIDDTAPTAPGNDASSNNSGSSWTVSSTNDYIYRVYTSAAPTVTPNSNAVTYSQIPTINVAISAGPPPGYGTATASWTTTQTATGVRPTVPPMLGSATATWVVMLAGSGARPARGTATASHTWSTAAQGKRPLIGNATAAHVWTIAPATGKKIMKGQATSTHLWTVTPVTGKRIQKGTSTAAHVWNAVATGTAPTLAVKQGSATAAHLWVVTPATGKKIQKGTATAPWLAAVRSLVDDDYNGAVDTTLASLGYLSMYGGTLYLDGNGSAYTKGGWGGNTNPNAVLNNSWMETAFRLDDTASYNISLLFRLPTASTANGVDTGYAVVISELGIGINRLGASKASVAQPLVNTKDYVVRADWTGASIKVSLDGTEILTWTDPAPLVGNYVGLYLDNNYAGTSDRLRYLRAGSAAVGKTPMNAPGAGTATATHTWNVTPSTGKRVMQGQATAAAHTWTVAPATGKKIPVTTQVTTSHLWTVAPATGVRPILGVKQGTAVATWTGTVAPATGKRITKTSSMTAAHVWTVAPNTGKKVMKGQATSAHTWTIGPSTGKPIRNGQATSTHLWTMAPATGRRVTYGQATSTHLWNTFPATGIVPIVGVKQGTAVASHTWAVAPATGKKFPQSQVTAAHVWTVSPSTGRKLMWGTAASAHTWTVSPSTGKRIMKTAQVTAAHLWNPVATGKRIMRGQTGSTHTWNIFPATGVMPILGLKQGTATSRHDWSTTATGKKVMSGTAAAAAHVWTLVATGRRVMRSSITAAHVWTVAPLVGGKPLRGSASTAHLWTLSAQGVRPVVGAKQGSAIASHTWTASPATGMRIMRGLATGGAHTWTASPATGKKIMRGTAATSTHLWVVGPATGKKIMGGSAAVNHLWSVSPSTGRKRPVALATVVHVWRTTAAGFRVTSGSTVVLFRFKPDIARGSPGVVGVVQGVWDGHPVVAMQYGDKPIFEIMMVEV